MLAVENRLTRLFQKKNTRILSIYFTAGFPNLQDTSVILQAIERAGADIIELGIPYSDPIADGPTIQMSNQIALNNGMTLRLLLEQIADLRQYCQLPVLLMGYINPVMQFGMEKFCEEISKIGVDGLILPDLPMYEFQRDYQELFAKHQLSNIFLVTPETSQERIRIIDEQSQGFIYIVSASSTTGQTGEISLHQETYFRRISSMQLKNPCLVGFGIHDRESFQKACRYMHGAIIGSAFIKNIHQSDQLENSIQQFIGKIIS
ncbi:MAG: tryptophan synthase subunit alpha [Microscillaceae bacterium]|nr:tryptophan synthase subunit alpha [Microscillaceae bacterium]